jgi:predicted TIM-barrel fold metal-dependent hydrolase
MHIFDADCHISPAGDGTLRHEALLQRMDRAGVERALVWLQPPYERGQLEAGNAYVAEAQQQHPDRLVGFGWADPRLGVERAKEAARRCLEAYGFPGVKLNGAQNEFVIDDDVLSLPVIEEITRLEGILALHIGGDSPENTHPWRAGNIARRFPELPILIVHIGGAAFHDLSRACIEVAAQHPNMTLIGSAVRAQSIIRAIEALGPERVCFGSDTPFELMHVEVAKYQALLDGVADEQGRKLVMGEAIRKVLGIPNQNP